MNMNPAELKARIEEARQRMREKPRIWTPKAGDEKVVKLIKIETLETEIGPGKFMILEEIDPETGDTARYSIPAHTVLENHMKLDGMYLLRYNGTRQGKAKGRSPYHDWSVEVIFEPETEVGKKEEGSAVTKK